MALFAADIYQVKMEILLKAEDGSVYIAHLKLKGDTKITGKHYKAQTRSRLVRGCVVPNE
jgi:hypothetical protein